MAFLSSLRRAASSRSFFTVVGEAKWRTVQIFGSIDAEMCSSTFQRLITLDADPAVKAITVLIDTPGGDVQSGLAIYDTLQLLRKRVDTLCVGTAASVGAVLLAAGTKGHRWALPESKIVIDELMTADCGGKGSDRVLQERQREAVTSILAKHTGQTAERVSECMKGNLCMDGGEALKFGLIDRVVPLRD